MASAAATPVDVGSVVAVRCGDQGGVVDVRAGSGPGGPRSGGALTGPPWTCPVMPARGLRVLV